MAACGRVLGEQRGLLEKRTACQPLLCLFNLSAKQKKCQMTNTQINWGGGQLSGSYYRMERDMKIICKFHTSIYSTKRTKFLLLLLNLDHQQWKVVSSTYCSIFTEQFFKRPSDNLSIILGLGSLILHGQNQYCFIFSKLFVISSHKAQNSAHHTQIEQLVLFSKAFNPKYQGRVDCTQYIVEELTGPKNLTKSLPKGRIYQNVATLDMVIRLI